MENTCLALLALEQRRLSGNGRRSGQWKTTENTGLRLQVRTYSVFLPYSQYDYFTMYQQCAVVHTAHVDTRKQDVTLKVL